MNEFRPAETGRKISLEPATGLPAALAAGLAAERLALWAVDRDFWAPRMLVARDTAGNVVGAALTSGRPHTAYRKIVDIIAAEDAVWGELLQAARDDHPPAEDSRPAPLVVHLEEHLAFAQLPHARREVLTQLGFENARRPVPSIPSTRAGDPTEVAAWSWWRHSAAPRLATYYGQTTEVTCGAVSALMALENLGRGSFDSEDLVVNRAAEIAFWRRATNLPACEPIGLAVETALLGRQEGLMRELPRVILSAEGPVLLEEFADNEPELLLRTDLQLESLRQAEEVGLTIERRWIEAGEIVDLVRGGAEALILIDLTELIDDPTPHWVLATDVIGDTLIVSDPWVHYPNGETWVDAFALPIPLEGIERIARWGDPAYRGVVVLPAP